MPKEHNGNGDSGEKVRSREVFKDKGQSVKLENPESFRADSRG
jgi:hypothetical protein